jgi:hypothetical protein
MAAVYTATVVGLLWGVVTGFCRNTNLNTVVVGDEKKINSHVTLSSK